MSTCPKCLSPDDGHPCLYPNACLIERNRQLAHVAQDYSDFTEEALLATFQYVERRIDELVNRRNEIRREIDSRVMAAREPCEGCEE